MDLSLLYGTGFGAGFGFSPFAADYSFAYPGFSSAAYGAPYSFGYPSFIGSFSYPSYYALTGPSELETIADYLGASRMASYYGGSGFFGMGRPFYSGYPSIGNPGIGLSIGAGLFNNHWPYGIPSFPYFWPGGWSAGGLSSSIYSGYPSAANAAAPAVDVIPAPQERNDEDDDEPQEKPSLVEPPTRPESSPAPVPTPPPTSATPGTVTPSAPVAPGATAPAQVQPQPGQPPAQEAADSATTKAEREKAWRDFFAQRGVLGRAIDPTGRKGVMVSSADPEKGTVGLQFAAGAALPRGYQRRLNGALGRLERVRKRMRNLPETMIFTVGPSATPIPIPARDAPRGAWREFRQDVWDALQPPAPPVEPLTPLPVTDAHPTADSGRQAVPDAHSATPEDRGSDTPREGAEATVADAVEVPAREPAPKMDVERRDTVRVPVGVADAGTQIQPDSPLTDADRTFAQALLQGSKVFGGGFPVSWRFQGEIKQYIDRAITLAKAETSAAGLIAGTYPWQAALAKTLFAFIVRDRRPAGWPLDKPLKGMGLGLTFAGYQESGATEGGEVQKIVDQPPEGGKNKRKNRGECTEQTACALAVFLEAGLTNVQPVHVEETRVGLAGVVTESPHATNHVCLLLADPAHPASRLLIDPGMKRLDEKGAIHSRYRRINYRELVAMQLGNAAAVAIDRHQWTRATSLIESAELLAPEFNYLKGMRSHFLFEQFLARRDVSALSRLADADTAAHEMLRRSVAPPSGSVRFTRDPMEKDDLARLFSPGMSLGEWGVRQMANARRAQGYYYAKGRAWNLAADRQGAYFSLLAGQRPSLGVIHQAFADLLSYTGRASQGKGLVALAAREYTQWLRDELGRLDVEVRVATKEKVGGIHRKQEEIRQRLDELKQYLPPAGTAQALA